MELRSLRFIDETIEVHFVVPPAFEKRPDCPAAFTWRGDFYGVTELLSEWRDYGRRGRMATNMRPEHAEIAAERGSWGVGRFFFRVRTDVGSIFDLYYDRAPKGTANRKGGWFLYRELTPVEDA
jgi:Domain of unknown function (DUF6504)